MIYTTNLFKNNSNNTELIKVAPKELLQNIEDLVDINGCFIILTPIVSNLGVISRTAISCVA